jgi:hypothetical protein
MDSTTYSRRHALGLPLWGIVALGGLAAPRVFLHDLGVVEEETGLAALLAVVPPVVWVVVAIRARITQPLVTLLAIGAVYGVVLAVVHNLLWDEAFGDSPPRLGGALAGELPPGAEELVLRFATAGSSVLTGVAVGLLCGLVVLLWQRWAGGSERGSSAPARRGER